MDGKDLSDQQVSKEERGIETSPIFVALMIGFLIGIVIYSVAVNNVGFLTLIPLYFVYRLLKGPQKES